MRHSRNDRKPALIIITVLNVLIFAASCVMFALTAKNVNQNTKETEVKTKASESAPKVKKSSSSKSSAKATAKSETKAADSETVVAPKELSNLLSAGGLSVDDLTQKNIKQLITVNPDSSNITSAAISLYELKDSAWTINENLSTQGFVGSQGTVTEMSEEISGTPKGLYQIGEAFYQGAAPETKLDSFKITEDTYWVSDPDSRFYNQRVEGIEEQDWKVAEHMSEIPDYKYGFVINYNMPAQYNKGSAIFFHIGSGPTQGCVAASEDMVCAYLKALDKARNPYILVI